MPIPWAAVGLYASRGWAAYQVAEAVRQEFCQFADTFPDFTSRVLGGGSGGGFFNSLVPIVCPDLPPPPPEPPPFVGGQCCATYIATWTNRYTIGGVQRVDLATALLSGQLGAIENDSYQTADGTWEANIYIWNAIGCGDTPEKAPLLVTANLDEKPEITDFFVTRADGLPDDCGDLPPSPSRRQPNRDDLNFDVNIDVGGVSISVPVSFNFNVASPNVVFSPTINFNTPFGDFEFTPDGVNIFPPSRPDSNDDGEYDPPFSLPPDPRQPRDRPPPWLPPSRPRPPSGLPPSPPPPPGGECPDVDLKPVLDALDLMDDKLDELLDCDRCLASPEECRKVLIGTGQSARVLISKDTLWIGIELTIIPINSKNQWGVAAPDVYFAGWYAFGGSGCEGDRNPVHYEKNIYPIVSMSSSFSYTLQSGYTANLYAYLKPEEET